MLYDYTFHDSAIKELEAELKEILERLSPAPKAATISAVGVGGYSEHSEPEKWAIRREENPHVRYLRGEIEKRKRHREAVLKAREYLTDEEEQFVTLFYDQNRPIRDCKRIMKYEKSKMYQMRQDIVLKVSKFLGII